jgi:ribose-phosphate pyrophosphokinase
MEKQHLIFSGSSHPVLAQKIAQHLGDTLGKISLGRFPDGEISVEIGENVRGRDIFVVQSIALHPNFYLMELLIIIDALKRASANSVTAVIPYFGYSRQDRKDSPRVPITAKLVADMITVAGANKVLTVDLHASQLEGFFDIPVDNLYARQVLSTAIKDSGYRDFVVVTPDIGSIKLARFFAIEAGTEFAIIDKLRLNATQVTDVNVIGDVGGRNVLLADDMCSTAGTLVSAAKACQEKGAKRILAAVTHGLLVGDAVKMIEESPIEALWMSDTIPPTERLSGGSKLVTVSVSGLIADAICCILSAKSISSLYKK